MAIAFVASSGTTTTVTAVTTKNLTLPAASYSAGSDVIALVSLSTTSVSVTFISDSKGNFYNFVCAVNNGTSVRCEMWIAHNIVTALTGAVDSLTFNFSGAATGVIGYSAYSGVGSVGHGLVTTESQTNPFMTLTTVGSNDFIVAGFAHLGTSTVTAGTGTLHSPNAAGATVAIACSHNTVVNATDVLTSVVCSDATWAICAVELKTAAVVSATQTTPYLGIWSKDAVLSCGTFDMGVPDALYGWYDDDFVAQFSGTTVGATATGIASVPPGVFSKDATLDGLFDD